MIERAKINPTLDRLGRRLQEVLEESVAQPIGARIRELLRRLDEAEQNQAKQDAARTGSKRQGSD
jgi:hypothetical protein